ncbi:MAG: Mth938-like domain-containing protein [Burkholderiales bacterium]
MKFHLQTPAGHNLFTGHGAGFVMVNGVRHAASILVAPERIDTWSATGFDSLNAQHFEQLLALSPAIVLLGTGASLRFPRPALSSCLQTAGIGVEVMDNAAACRTYNILTAEGRNVVAAILLG